LANYLLQRHKLALGRDTTGLSADAMSKLVAYDWPGNVRELENVIERALVLSTGTVLCESDIDIAADHRVPVNTSFKAQKAQVVNEFERRYLQETVTRCGGNITLAAKAAQKNRRAFFELLRKHHVVAGRRPRATDFARGG
jgi:two-component system response regulator GlrR